MVVKGWFRFASPTFIAALRLQTFHINHYPFPSERE